MPHFGDWTHDGQPCSHGQPAIILSVSAAQPSNADFLFYAMIAFVEERLLKK